MMRIYSDKSNVIITLCIWILIMFVAVFFMVLGGAVPALGLFLCGTALSISYYIAINRTITMDASGCKVALWKYLREYTWEELSVKRIESFHIGLRLSYHNGGAFFSVYPVRKPLWLDPILFCAIIRPFSTFFVYFKNGDKMSTPGIYEVDKHIFLEQLDLWGIRLDIE